MQDATPIIAITNAIPATGYPQVMWLGCHHFALRSGAIVIQSVDFVLVEALITDLHPSGEGPECAQFFDGVMDGLSRGRETAVFGVTPSAPRQKQFSR
jgi:hypothetical protein